MYSLPSVSGDGLSTLICAPGLAHGVNRAYNLAQTGD
jgi:hypothetical protein